jgi:hypothetical protein
MVAGNSLNISTAGIVVFDGVASFTADTTTQYNTLVGGANNTIVSIATGSSGQILTSTGAAGNPSFQTVPFTQLPWTDEAVSFNALAGNGYFISATATATMPASPSQGNTIAFTVDTASILTITGNTGQLLRIGKNASVAAGTAKSNFIGDSVTFVYRASDTTWLADSVIGTWTLT